MTLDAILAHFHELPFPAQLSRWRELSRNMRIHTRGEDPMEILIRRHAREDDDCFAWRKKNYAAITRPLAQEGLQRLRHILQESGFELQTSPALTPFLLERRFGGQDFFQFLQNDVFQAMIEDPNGLLVWTPDVQNPQRIRPILVDSERIRYQDENSLVFLANETVLLETENGQRSPVGKVFYALDNREIARIVQKGRAGAETYVAEPLCQHNFGFLPYVTLGGVSAGAGCYESYFQAFVPFANEALKQFSDWQVVMADSAYPIKEIHPIVCRAEGCTHGKTYHNGKTETCKTCNGTGYEWKTGPFAALVRPEVNPLTQEADPRPLVSYITPPTEIIRYAHEAWQALLDRAREALNLNAIREPQSGAAKRIDRENLYAMLAVVADNVYDNLMRHSLNILEHFYNPAAPQPVVLRKPLSFSVKTEMELQEEFTALAKDNFSAHLTHQAALSLADRKFGEDGLHRKIQQTLALFDPLLYDSFAVQKQKLEAGAVLPKDLQRSARAYWAAQQLLERYGAEWFRQTNVWDICQRLEKEIFEPN